MVKPLPGIAERYLTWPASEDDNTCSSTVVSDSRVCPWARPDVLHLRPKLSVPHPSVAEQVVGIRVSLCASVEQHALALVRHAMTPTRSGACVRSGSPLPAVPLPRVAQWGVYEFDLTAASKHRHARAVCVIGHCVAEPRPGADILLLGPVRSIPRPRVDVPMR